MEFWRWSIILRPSAHFQYRTGTSTFFFHLCRYLHIRSTRVIGSDPVLMQVNIRSSHQQRFNVHIIRMDVIRMFVSTGCGLNYAHFLPLFPVCTELFGPYELAWIVDSSPFCILVSCADSRSLQFR